ncbi:MAG: hypothetical protein NVS3B20_03300 [Polyangiales bacterium]
MTEVGAPLRPPERLDRRLERGAVEIDEVVEIARMLAVYLDAEHEAGRTDGSMRPSRIEVRVGGAPRLRPVEASLDRLDEVDVKAYTAPEAWNHRPTKASDQFAMAAVLYEALCGGRAFPGDDSDKIHASITTGSRVPLAARVPGLAEAVDSVFEKALSVIPSERYGSCAAFALALVAAIERSRDAAAEGEVLVRKPSSNPSTRRSFRDDEFDSWDSPAQNAPIPWLKVAVGLILLALVAAALAVISGK